MALALVLLASLASAAPDPATCLDESAHRRARHAALQHRIAYVLVPVYDGAMPVPGLHTHVFGIDENVFAFGVLSIVMAAAVALLVSAAQREVDHAV
jgi:hypothetical protein